MIALAALFLAAQAQPNILLAISDDQSWLHTGANGDLAVATPAFDRIAREGVRFVHSFTASPSCTPSRGALLSGRPVWLLGTAATLHGSLPEDLPLFTDALATHGYDVGFTGKGWGPGRAQGRSPTGRAFRERRLDPRRPGMNALDYAANFEQFLAQRRPGRPFCFWYGASEPHRTYDRGAGQRAGKRIADARVPRSLPDSPTVRSDVLDYYLEIEHLDRHLGRMLAALERRGELDDTLVIVTSDHGMPFPRAKCNPYDEGTRVPLAIRWPQRIPRGRVVTDFVSLIDLAPTILSAAGAAPLPGATGRSLWPILDSDRTGRIDPTRDEVVIALERHVVARASGLGYPWRALRTRDWLYVENAAPHRWPAGDPPPFAITPGRSWADIDDGPTKQLIVTEPRWQRELELATGRRSARELYDLRADPGQLENLAADPAYRDRLRELGARLATELETDPRRHGEAPWDDNSCQAGYLSPERRRTPRELSHGPFLGHVDPTGARIWLRCTRPGPVDLVLEPGPIRVKANATDATDRCVVFRVDGLRPGTRYRYRIERGGALLRGGDELTFTTPDPDAPVRLAFGSCAREDDATARTWRRIRQLAPDALVLLGDTPYIDTTDLAVQRRRYREFAAQPALAALLRSTPLYATWDDHDFGHNDTDGRLPGKADARRAFVEYRPNPTAGDGSSGVYTRFARGDVEVFLLDTRTFAATEPSPVDATEPTLLGAHQWRWLRAALRSSEATYKLLCSGMIWNGATRPNKPDHWEAYAHERDALFDFIGRHEIGGVVLIGGDIHRSRVIRHATAARSGYDILELITSPLHGEIIVEANAPHPGLVVDLGEPYSFLLIEIDTELRASFLNASGAVLHRLEFEP